MTVANEKESTVIIFGCRFTFCPKEYLHETNYCVHFLTTLNFGQDCTLIIKYCKILKLLCEGFRNTWEIRLINENNNPERPIVNRDKSCLSMEKQILLRNLSGAIKRKKCYVADSYVTPIEK